MEDYLIIEFNDSMNDKEEKSIDCVPNKWVILDENIGELKTSFLPPLRMHKKCQRFHHIVETKQDPDYNPRI